MACDVRPMFDDRRGPRLTRGCRMPAYDARCSGGYGYTADARTMCGCHFRDHPSRGRRPCVMSAVTQPGQKYGSGKVLGGGRPGRRPLSLWARIAIREKSSAAPRGPLSTLWRLGGPEMGGGLRRPLDVGTLGKIAESEERCQPNVKLRQHPEAFFVSRTEDEQVRCQRDAEKSGDVDGLVDRC